MKVFKLGFYETSDECPLPEYPISSELKAQYTFEDMSTWVPILWQCCKFLEATGYSGVTEKIIIRDPFGMHDGGLFETTYDEEFDFDDEEDDDLTDEDNDYNEEK